MRNIITTCFAALLAVLSQGSSPCYAAPGVKTTPHVIPLHFVTRLPDDPIIPRVALRADFVAYPRVPLYKEFLDAPQDSPERTVARYVQVLSDNQATLTPQTLNEAKNFYAEDERTKDGNILAKLIEDDHSSIASIYSPKNRANLRLWHRYDAGPLTIITLAFPSKVQPNGFQPILNLYLRKIGSSYFSTSYATGSRKEHPELNAIIELSDSLLCWKPKLAQVPQPAYPYHFPLPVSLPGVTSAANRLEVVFTGKVSNILVDENMVPADPLQAFLQRAIQIQRTGTPKEFLTLWTSDDQRDSFAPQLKETPDAIPPSSLDFAWQGNQVRLVFTLDFKVGAVVFFRAIDPTKSQTSGELQYLTVWKQAPDDYRLSDSGTLNKRTILFGNLRLLFNSPEFQAYLNAQVDQFIKEQNTKKGAEGTPAPGNK